MDDAGQLDCSTVWTDYEYDSLLLSVLTLRQQSPPKLNYRKNLMLMHINYSEFGATLKTLYCGYWLLVCAGKYCAEEDRKDGAELDGAKPRPYMCTTCEKRFTCRANLIIHAKTHSGVKPYECSVCNKRFVTSGRLLRHQTSHTQVQLMETHVFYFKPYTLVKVG